MNGVTREEIISSNPLTEAVASRGIVLKPSGAGRMVGLCPFHKESTPSFTVTGNLFHCFGCQAGGSVIDFVSKFDGVGVGEAMKKLTPESSRSEAKRPALADVPRGEIECVYPYHDETGELVYEVVRLKPKSFRQRRIVGGKAVWTMEGARRVLYRLPEVIKSQFVWVTEGEKDADNLRALGLCATCNAGGAGKWMDGYTEALKGKDVVLCGDSDQAGKKHMDAVLESIGPVAKSVRVIRIPDPHKDVSDYLAAIGGTLEEKGALLGGLCQAAPLLTGGIFLPIKGMAELEDDYIESIANARTSVLNLGKWLPSLGFRVRGLVPGELVTILADTGVGKTMILQNIAKHAAPIVTLLFEMELPGSLTFERFLALDTKTSAQKIYDAYASNDPGRPDLKANPRLQHVFVCCESKLTTEKIEQLIIKSELKIGERPRLVLLDYIGLVHGRGSSRYERMSTIAEDLKVLAKSTQTIIVIASQVSRNKEDRTEVFLHDAKDSGSIENSSGLVLGAWRDEKDKSLMFIKVLKNTKGTGGDKIPCNVDGTMSLITERKESPYTMKGME